MIRLSGLQLAAKKHRSTARDTFGLPRLLQGVCWSMGCADGKPARREEVSMPELRSVIRLCVATAIGLVLSTGLFYAQAQERELKVGYMKNPIQDASLDIMEKWAKDHGVKLTRVPMAYSVFMEKVTATLTTGTDQFDVIWHNDDWGQLWKKWLDT